MRISLTFLCAAAPKGRIRSPALKGRTLNGAGTVPASNTAPRCPSSRFLTSRWKRSGSFPDSRFLARRPTLITTNFPDVSARESAQADHLARKEYLVDRIGQRLRSRLTEMCLRVPLDGEDFRERRQTANRNAVMGTSGAAPDPPPAPPPPGRPRFGG